MKLNEHIQYCTFVQYICSFEIVQFIRGGGVLFSYIFFELLKNVVLKPTTTPRRRPHRIDGIIEHENMGCFLEHPMKNSMK